MVGKTLAIHVLSGNFATDRVSTLNNEANSIDPSAFLPQRNTCMVKQECIRDMITNTNKRMDVLDTHKSKAKTSIALKPLYQHGFHYHSHHHHQQPVAHPPSVLDEIHQTHQQHQVGLLV